MLSSTQIKTILFGLIFFLISCSQNENTSNSFTTSENYSELKEYGFYVLRRRWGLGGDHQKCIISTDIRNGKEYDKETDFLSIGSFSSLYYEVNEESVIIYYQYEFTKPRKNQNLKKKLLFRSSIYDLHEAEEKYNSGNGNIKKLFD